MTHRDWWKPELLASGVEKITADELTSMGCSALIIDLDNTLAPWNSQLVDPVKRGWCAGLVSRGVKLCVLSNNRERRVRPVAESLGALWVCDAGKPGKRAFARAVERLGVPKEQCMVVGDQLFTDVFGAKRYGLRAALVNPIGKKELLYTRCVRVIERIALRALGIRRP